jgi:hypothetical protein
MAPTEVARMKVLKATPKEFNQGDHGCCGPAGTIMGLLQFFPAEVDALWVSLHDSEEFRKIKGSDDAATGLAKRFSLDAFAAEEKKDYFLDVKLSVGLLLILKAALKASGKTDLWKACDAYSQVFPGWTHGAKLSAGHTLRGSFSYKNGDIALTNEVTKFLLETVGFKGVEIKELLPKATIATKKDALASLWTDAAYSKSVKDLLTAINGGTYAGALVGMAAKPFLDPPIATEAAKYGYLGHWVYLPKQAVPSAADVSGVKCWTWGAEWTIGNLLKAPPAGVPPLFASVALPFKKS